MICQRSFKCVRSVVRYFIPAVLVDRLTHWHEGLRRTRSRRLHARGRHDGNGFIVRLLAIVLVIRSLHSLLVRVYYPFDLLVASEKPIRGPDPMKVPAKRFELLLTKAITIACGRC